MSKILVTGANGYIGSHVVLSLINYGHQVIAADMNNTRIHPKADFIRLNIFEDKEIMKKADYPDICLHLAWRDGFNHSSENHIDDLSKHYHFLTGLIEDGLKHLAVMGTMHEIGYYEGCIDENTPCNPLSMYGIAKNALRQALNVYLQNKENVSFKWLRAFYITGDDNENNSIFAKIIKMEKDGKATFPFTSGENKYDFQDIGDLAEQITETISQDKINGIINCCSGKPVALKDKVETFLMDKKFKIRPEYGAYPDRDYDSPAIWGSNDKIIKILEENK